MQLRKLHFMMLGLAVAASGATGTSAHTGENTSTATGSGAHRHQARAVQDDQATPRLLNLGSHTFPVSTRSKSAQQFMNQGLNLSYAFNHAEAGRSFREAARLDPLLAMAYWGQALVLGPNINAMMESKDETAALDLVRKAASLMAKASPRERALISALEKRYTGSSEQRKENNRAYADAMREVHTRFPDDLDIAMLYVESMMDLNSWGYWMRDGYPLEGTAEIVALTESVIRRNPRHPGAVHMYIHLVEPTSTPERAEKAADTLLTLMPAAGHAVHMPSHIYQRVGRYADAIKSNQLAIAADEEYLSHSHAQGMYRVMYTPHNIHFLWFAATMDGQSRLAIESARKVAGAIDDAALETVPGAGTFRVTPYWAYAKFGKWNEILQEPAPPATNAFLKGGWHYVRGLAFAATRQLPQAEQELEALRGILQNGSLDWPLMSLNTARDVLSIGPEVLAGEIAAARGQFDSAIAYLDRAVRIEDALVYTEPSEWQSPPRLALGAVLLEAGRAAEAETVYWEDLRKNRNNGWALYGLLQTLRAQKKDDQAALVEARFRNAWARADIALNASRFGCIAAPPAGSAQ
ncbi:lipopolysaccharide assembly protein LapB [Nitrosospira sp. NpAV]|uniref:tetratricopeptide repeat protein n=1 Tax=Nitrosospira sp. NpAV TaxID=58133 RepID=UPI0005A17DFA|nr:tetratricopeptide repeat protein [Nitrosospira sp. NpAV]KIO48726.1 tetratricopeptide repeat protein [Nitrosospira sp. NpAV]